MLRTVTAAELCCTAGLILDVRSPAEYQQGHIPGAVNLPLFDDGERRLVGICYKQEGRDRAVELGFALAGPKIAELIARARELAPDRSLTLHCWRGGMRSGAVAWALDLAGFEVAVLEGGYKAFRRWGRAQLCQRQTTIVVGGMTGTGKTAVLHALAARGEQVLDLEGLAQHRGSSYGSLDQPPQPTNEQFWNEVMWQWAGFQRQRIVWIEAESKRIGTCRIPDEIFGQMERSPVVEIVRSRPERLQILLEVYGKSDRQALRAATQRIRKRLGGLRAQQALDALDQGRLQDCADLVLQYYDKTYRYDLERRHSSLYRCHAAGLTASEVAEQLIHLGAIAVT